MKTILKGKQQAFSLIELLIALCVFALITILALPSFSSMIMDARMSAATNALVAALNYARTTALNQTMQVKVCPFSAANSTTCGNNWNLGWIVVSVPTLTVSTLLQSKQFTSADPVLSSTVTSVVFDAHGTSTTQSNFKYCDSRGATYAQSIEVLSTGFVQNGSTAGVAIWNNTALTCP